MSSRGGIRSGSGRKLLSPPSFERKGGGIRSGSGRKLLSPCSRLVLKEKKKKNDCQTALAHSVDYYDFYWFKKIVVNQDRTCALS